MKLRIVFESRSRVVEWGDRNVTKELIFLGVADADGNPLDTDSARFTWLADGDYESLEIDTNKL